MTRTALALGCAATLAMGCAAPARLAIDQPLAPIDSSAMSRYIAEVNRATAGTRVSRAAEAPRLEQRDADLFSAQAALALSPSAEHHRDLAEVYAARGVLDQAYDHFTAALAKSPKDVRALEGRARVWRDWGSPQLGLADAHRAVYYAPASASARNTLGTVLTKLGLLSEAESVFEAARVRAPGAAYVLNNVCYVRLLAGRALESIAACRDALALSPDSKTARNNLALAYAAAGDVQAAHREFLRAGNAASASFNLGMALTSVGRFNEAARAFDTASQLEPALSEARARAVEARRRASSASPATASPTIAAPARRLP